MRILTFGVLIVVVGTLAALPFRRYQTIPDASNGQQTVTPTHVPPPDAGRERLVKTVGPPRTLNAAHEIIANLPQPTPYRANARRQPSPSISYEELAVPIQRSEQAQRRFSATAPPQQSQLSHEREAAGGPVHSHSIGFAMPGMEMLTVSQRDEIRELVSVQAEKQVRPPAASPTTREKQWIRQPD